VKPLALVLLASAAWAASPPSVDTLLAEMSASAQKTTTLAGEFTQKNRLKLFKQELSSKGRLFFQAPRRIRWEYLSPDPSVMVLDADRATLRTPGAAPQVFDLAHDATMRAVFDQLLMWLAPGGLESARADYDLSTAGSGAEPSLVLVPKASSAVAKAFARIELRVDGKSHLLRGIKLTEKNGDEKQIDFAKLERNATLPKDAFQ
jgi:outer membrane lipoprotein-sorting protein